MHVLTLSGSVQNRTAMVQELNSNSINQNLWNGLCTPVLCLFVQTMRCVRRSFERRVAATRLTRAAIREQEEREAEAALAEGELAALDAFSALAGAPALASATSRCLVVNPEP